jgi:predicted TIM-barrel fold metal-dependent hydrolase
MMIDVHTHIFSKDIRENREKYFPDESAFRLLYEPPKSKLVSADELINAMDEEGVDMSVIFGFPWRKADTFKRENDYILESVHKYPKRLIGLCCFDVFHPEAASETERCLDAGLSGVGELALYQSGIDEEALKRLDPIMAICRDKKYPILIHTNEPVGHLYPGKTPNTLMQIYNLVRRFPENIIVLAHWGGGIFFYNLLKKEVKESLKHVYFDTAASPFLYEPDIYAIAAKLIGIDKILLGTDFPLLKPARYFKELEKSGLSADEIRAVCGGNAGKLWCDV